MSILSLNFLSVLTRSLLLGVGLFFGISESAINLTAVPVGMRKQNMDITLGWTGGAGRVHLRASSVPGSTNTAISHYDSLHLPSQMGTGDLTFRINPDIPLLYRNTDLRYGVNYCILSDGISASPEFIVLIESSNAPVLTSPANAASLKDLTPTFSWTGDAPYYAVLVSDEPFKISDSGTVTGVSAVWQIITPYNSARYGDADPSGINTLTAPPLISGKTYNWLVLNNYGNNSGSTSKVAPVPFSFVYSPSPPLPQATLLEPKDKETINGGDQILFRWAQVEGAVSYKIELLEENLVDGSQADISLWKATSTGGQLILDNATGLLRRYNYKWRVYAIGNNGSASLSEKRSFFFAVDVGKISVYLKNLAGQKIAYAPIKINRLGGSSSAVFQGGSTDNEGILTVNNAPLGNYETRVENLDGYSSRTDTVVHSNINGTALVVTLSPVLGKILGKVSTLTNGTGILNAKVKVLGSSGAELSTVTNSQGNYSLGVPFGNWQIDAQSIGYANSNPTNISLNSTQNSKTVDLTLTPNSFTLSGTVSNSFSRQGIFGATVFLSIGLQTQTINTDGNGNFSFSVPNGAMNLRVSSAGFAAPEQVNLIVDGDKSVNISLDPNASILSGRSKDLSGTGLSNIVIQATPKSGSIRSVFTDKQGHYELSLPAGDWVLNPVAKGYSTQSSHKFLLDVSKTVQGVDFTLEPNHSFIAGRATVNGSGLTGVKISVGDAIALTDNSGYYLLAVNSGTQTVLATKEGYLISKVYTLPVNLGDTVVNIDFPASGNAGVVKGRVLAGGAAVVQANVKAVNQGNKEGFQQFTDGDGGFTLSLPGGDYSITTSKEGFAQDQTVSVSVVPGGTILDANLRMLPNQAGIQGAVASGNSSLGGCEVSYRNEMDGEMAGKTVTDPQGRYSLSLQAGASYKISIACVGYQVMANSSGSLVRGNTISLDFNITKAGAIFRGKVIDERGNALPGVRLTAEKEGSLTVSSTDFSGLYSLSLGAGIYSITFSKSGYRNIFRTVQLSLGDNFVETSDTMITSIGKLSGRVVTDGIAVDGALITLVGLSPEAGGGTFTSDGDGRFSRDNLPAGNYSLFASSLGFTDTKIPTLTLIAGQLTSVDVKLVANKGIISGSVQSSGSPLSGVSIVANAYGISRSTVTGGDGHFNLEKLPGGVFSISASLVGFSADKSWDNQTLSNTGTLPKVNFIFTKNVGSLEGTVSGAAISNGIRISLLGRKGVRAFGVCDGSGKYSIASLPTDDYTLSITAPGYKLSGATQTPSITVDAPKIFNPVLLPAVFKLIGKVVNQIDQAVSATPMEFSTSRTKFTTISGSDGSFSFDEVPLGDEYKLACKPPTSEIEARDTTFALSLEAPSLVTANLKTLSRGASLSGTIFLDEVAVEGASIRLTGKNNTLAAISQPGGGFKVFGVAGSDAALTLAVSKTGSNTFDTSIVVKVGEAKGGMVIKLKTLKLNLSIAFLNSEGKAVRSAKIVAAYPKKLDTLVASAEGNVTIEGIAANQNVTLVTILNKLDYDNLETSILIKEKNSSVTLTPTIHASTLNIQVKDQADQIVNGADILVNGRNMGMTTDGQLISSHLPKGEYRVAAGKASFKSGPDQILILSGDTTVSLVMRLTKITGGLYGSVKDSGFLATGGSTVSRKLPGAVVLLTSVSDTIRDTVNSLGQYFVDGLVNDRKYRASVTLPGYFLFENTITGNPLSQNFDFTLKPYPGSVLGKLETGKSGVQIRLVHSATSQVKSVQTILGGYYAFTGLENRSDYSVQALDGSLSSQSMSFQANGALSKRFDPSLELWGGAKGKIVSVSSTSTIPVTGALMSAKNTLSGNITWSVTDTAGKFSIVGLGSGKYELSVERKGYSTPKPTLITIEKGIILQDVNFSMEEIDAGIGGLVTDENGQGLSVLVYLVSDKDTVRQQTDGGGQFVFAGQAFGSYRLLAVKSGFFLTAPVNVSYSGKGLKIQNVVLLRNKNRITGVVKDGLTNTPINGVQLALSVGSSLVLSDTLGRFDLALGATPGSPTYLDVSMEGYLPRMHLPIYLESDGSSIQDIVLSADYKFDGEIDVLVKEGKDTVSGAYITAEPFHPDDSLNFSISGKASNSFPKLRYPAPYTLRVKRTGFKDLVKVVNLTAKNPTLRTILSYPNSQIRVFVTSDGKHGKGVDLSLNGQPLNESVDTVGLYASAAKLKPGPYEVSIKDRESHLIPLAPFFIALGEDSIRTDTLPETFFEIPILDSTIGAPFKVRVNRSDSLKPISMVLCSLYYRIEGDVLWNSIKLEENSGGFSAQFPEQIRPGLYQYYYNLISPLGVSSTIVTSEKTLHVTGKIAYSNSQSPGKFKLRDPFLLQSIALLPQRLEADTSLYSLGAKDLFQVQIRGENSRNLNSYFDQKKTSGDTGLTISWKFLNAAYASGKGLLLSVDSASPRLCHFRGSKSPSDSTFQVLCSVRMGTVSLKKSFFIRIQDLWPISVGIKYVKENREMEEDGASLPFSNLTTTGYAFSAFAKTQEGRVFNISPRWSFGSDSAIGKITQQGLFFPDTNVARSAALRIYDTLPIGMTNVGEPIRAAFVSQANLVTFTQVVPSSQGRTVVTNGEGTSLDFNLAGLSKAFTVSVKKPKVSGLLRSSPKEEVVGEILDIELSERQPFKADSGAVLKMPVSDGIARRAWVYLGHWNTARLSWEKVDSVKGGTSVDGKVYSFSKYAVIMGSLPLGAYDFSFAPNPFSSQDPWGLQMSYKVSSDVSSQVGVRVEVYNMTGDKVYESHEVQLSKGDVVKPGLKKAALNSTERRYSLGPYVWDGHDSQGVPCRNGRYLIKLIVKDGRGSKTYLKKVVMLK